MKAYQHVTYGSAKHLQLENVARPTPGAGEVVIEVRVVSINPLDWRTMMANPALIRISKGLLRPKKTILGADVAGVIVEVGAGVDDVAVGDRVVGELDTGGFAEFVCTTVARIVKIPENVSFEHAAALPVAGLTAIQGLQDHGNIQSGERVLINGASGGVGTYALQLAKYYGATVDAVCSGRNSKLVKGLGAAAVFDYTKEDYTKHGQRYDLIYDAVGNRSAQDHVRCLNDGGRCVVAGFTTMGRLASVVLAAKRISRTTGKTIKTFVAKPNHDDLVALLHLLSTDQIVSIIERTYTFDQIPEALDYGATKRTRGKLVVVY